MIGSIDTAIGTRDAHDNIVNDPYPTAFFSAGFDLNSIGVIHNILTDTNTNSSARITKSNIELYPNPSSHFIKLTSKSVVQDYASFVIYNPLGQIVMHKVQFDLKDAINIEQLPSGKYHIQIYSGNQILGNEAFIKE